MDNELKKSIDALIDDIFEDNLEKSTVIEAEADTTADEAIKKAPKAQKDESRNAGRPEQISDVPEKDKDGDRTGEYDKDITENKNKEDEPKEKDQVKTPDQMKKSVSDEEWAEFEAFKKSKKEAADKEKAEVLAKAQKEAFQSVAEELRKSFESKTEELKKSLTEMQKRNDEQSVIIKAMAKQPMPSKSVTGIGELKKGYDDSVEAPKTFSKKEITDAALELRKSNKLSDADVIELDTFGHSANPKIRSLVENYLKNK